MKKPVRQRIEKFARLVRAIQDLSLAQLRRCRDDGLAEYEIAIIAVMKALGIKEDIVWREAAVALSAMRNAPPGHLTGSAIRNAIECRTFLQNDVHQCVVNVLQAQIDAVFKDAIAAKRETLVATRLSRWPCSRIIAVSEDNRSAKISSRKLYLLAVDDIFAGTGVKLEVKLDRGIDEITFEDLLLITGDVKTFTLSIITYISMKPGSVRLIIEIKSEDARRLLRLYREGSIKTLGGISVTTMDEMAISSPSIGIPEESFSIMLDLNDPLTNIDRQRLAEFVAHEKSRPQQEQSWLSRRLFSLLSWLNTRQLHFSLWGRLTLAAIFIGASICRCFVNLLLVLFPKRLGTPESLENLRGSASRWLASSWNEVNRVKLRNEGVEAFVIWPLMTALSIMAILLTFSKPDFGALVWSSASGALLSVAGGLVCGSVLSVTACGAAGVVLGTAFGVVHGLILVGNGGIGGILTVAARNSSFTRIVGGLVAVDAPRSMGSNLAWAVVALGIPAIGIACAAKLMARPLEIREASSESHPAIWREIIGAVLGSWAGVGIFILMKCTELLSRLVTERNAFLIAYIFVTALALAYLFRLRVASAMRVSIFTLAFLACGSLLVIGALWQPIGWPSLLANSGATGMFHAVFFTLAWLIGYRVAGWRAGVAAAILEGVGGYVGFALSRAF